MVDFEDENESQVITRPRTKVRRPRMYKVLLHNDDYSSMDFVVEILESIFHLPPVVAAQIMMKVHNEGKAAVGTYTREVAESKVKQVEDRAMQQGFPLLCTMEEA